MTKQTIIFIFALGLLLTSCAKKIEVIEEKDDAGQITAIYERRADDFAKHGYYKAYHETGQLFEESIYLDNKLNGLRKLYYKNGNVEAEELYENDQLQGTFKSYNQKGNLTGEGQYVDNAMKGIWKFFYSSGKIKEEVTFANNAENGPFKEYYENGKLKTEGQYRGGDHEVGELKKYDEQGELIEKLDCELTSMGDVAFSKCVSSWKKE